MHIADDGLKRNELPDKTMGSAAPGEIRTLPIAWALTSYKPRTVLCAGVNFLI